MATPDSFRFENLSPKDVSAVRGSISNMGLDPQFAMNAETFNKLPKDKREALFSQLENIQLASAQPDVSVVRADSPGISEITIGNRVVRFEQPDEGDDTAQLNALSRKVDDPQASSVTPTTPEEERLLGELSAPVPPAFSQEEAGSYYAQGAAKEASTMGATGLGFLTGFRLGAPVAALAAPGMGPFAPAAAAIPFVTGAIGAVAGYQGAKSLADSLVEDPNPEDLGYPSFEAGRTLGGSIAMAPLAFFIPASFALRFGRIGPFVSRIGESARAYPKSFLLGESTAAGSSSFGTYIAEREFPGEAGKRFGLEAAFGMADPARIVPLATSKGFDILKAGWSWRNQEGRQAFAASRSQATMDKATKRFIDIFEQYGEDIPELIKRLEEPLVGEPKVDYPPIGALTGRTGPTAAQKTGSLVVTQLETALSALDPKFAADATEQGRQSLLSYSLVLDQLKKIGSPDALRAAATIRSDFFDSALEARLNRAATRAEVKFKRITADSPQARVDIGRTIHNEVQLALTNAREAERVFWLKAQQQALTPKATRPVKIPNTLAPDTLVNVYLDRVSRITPEFVGSLVPSDVRALMKRLGVTDEVIARYRAGRNTRQFVETGVMNSRYRPPPGAIKNISAEELINSRSNVLTLGRQASARGEAAQADFYSEMQTAMMDDLSTLPGDAYDTARSFSKALNDAFTRTFANDILAVTRTGAPKIPIETLVDTAFGAGADRTALRMGQIENAVGFLKKQLDDASIDKASSPEEAARLRELQSITSEGIVSIRDAQSRVLRLAAAKTLRTDPTGAVRLNPVQLNKFVNENKALLDQMGITGDLLDAQQAENLLAAVIKQNSALNTTIRHQMAFSKIRGVESPKTVIANALSPNNPYPIRSMREIADLARKNGPEAVEGLKASIYDYVFTKSSGGTTKTDPQIYYDTFFTPYAVDQPALAEILRTTGIMSPEEIKNVRAIADQMRVVEDAMANQRKLENFLQGTDVVGELAMRVVGSKIGTAASGGGPGALIAASAGSKAIRQIFDQMPMLAIRQMMQDAARNPQLLAQLLRRNMSEREKFLFARRLHAYTMSAGLNYIAYTPSPEEAALETERQATQETYKNIRDMPLNPVFVDPASSQERLRRAFPPAPPVRGMPGMSGGQPPTGGAPPTSQSRMMLQQLFPNDAITGAAAAQGGAPPMPG